MEILAYIGSILLAILYFVFRRRAGGSSGGGSDAAAAASGAGTQEVDVGEAESFELGGMREVAVGGEGSKDKVLVVRTKANKFYAVGTKCTHYGAPLVKGVTSGDRIMCPWHSACFNLTTGDIEDGPVLDAIPSYQCRVSGGRVLVRVPRQFPRSHKRQPRMCRSRHGDNRVFLVLGGGPAGAAAVETLRQEGYTGRIVLVNAEKHLPYDRVKLSKNMSVTANDVCLRPEDFFREHDVEVIVGHAATIVDPTAKAVRLDDGRTLRYDKLLLATGARCRSFRQGERFTIPGAELGNVFTLRTVEDARAIETAVAESSNVVVMGSSFIGMEAAAYFAQSRKVRNVVVIGMESAPFERVLGVEVGRALQQLHTEHGVQFRLPAGVLAFHPRDGDSGTVGAVELNSGEVLPADVVVIGAGVMPVTEYLELPTKCPDGSLSVDEHLRVRGLEDVWAAGDIATFPYFRSRSNETVRVEHYDVAMDQGRVAARNMAGVEVPYRVVPFFWTQQFGKSVRYAGHAKNIDRVLMEGSVQEHRFVAYYVCDSENAVQAVATLNADPVAVAAAELMRRNDMPTPAQVVGKGIDFLPTYLKDV